VAVDAVARAAGLSRRVLERRFRRELNSSVQAEIRRVRTDQIARLLVETHMPISEIADSLQFTDPQHFARYFRASKQISPLSYRRQYGRRFAVNPSP
jgi:LacI family transcriptional regulator